jgi:uncharacterized protein
VVRVTLSKLSKPQEEFSAEYVEQARNNLIAWFKPYSEICVLVSGGIDSSLIAHVAATYKDSKRVIAVTADSASIAREELSHVRTFIRGLQIEHRIVATDELADPQYRANSGDRCYYCKKALYRVVDDVVATYTNAVVVDGTNADDMSDHRPSLPASKEHGVLHPYVELAFGKSLIREISKSCGISFWDKPSMACLASRIQESIEVSTENLQMVEQAESVLRDIGYQDFRVRYHESGQANRLQKIARIELSKEEFNKFMQRSDPTALVESLSKLGFHHVTLDLGGYKRGGRALRVVPLP